MSPARGRFAGIWGPGDNGVLNAGGASPNTDWVPERDGRSASEGRWDGTGARGRRGEGCGGASWPPGRTRAGRWVPGRPAAGRGSAQVGTRLRFRHRRAQRLRPKRRCRSPPGPGRAAGEGRRHRSRRTEPARPRRGHPPPRPAHPLQRFLPGGFPGEGPPAGAWRGPGRRPPGLGTRDPEDALLSAALPHPPAPGSEGRARGGVTGPGGSGGHRCQHLAGGVAAALPKPQGSARTPLPIPWAASGRQGSSLGAGPPRLRLRPGPRGARLPAGEAPAAPDAAITLNGNAPRRSVRSPRPAWVGMEAATGSGETPTRSEWSRAPRRRQGSELHARPRLRGGAGMPPRAALRCGAREEERARARRVLPQTLLATRGGSERAGERRPRRARAPPARGAVAAPGQLRRAQTSRRPSFVAAALAARGSAPAAAVARPPARLCAALPALPAAARAAPPRGSRPLKPEPFPGRGARSANQRRAPRRPDSARLPSLRAAGAGRPAGTARGRAAVGTPRRRGILREPGRSLHPGRRPGRWWPGDGVPWSPFKSENK